MRGVFEIVQALGLPMPMGVLQVGANTGQEIDEFLRNGIRRAVLIEPLPGPYSVLEARCREIPGYLPVQTLCGALDGEVVEFHVATNNGESSSILRPAKHLSDYPWVQFPSTLSMQTFTLDKIYAAVQHHHPEIAQDLDLLFMDVQGAELHVQKGANRALSMVRYIYTEVGLGGGYDGSVALPDLIAYLRLYGFEIYELEMNAAGWGNAMFIKQGLFSAAQT